VALAAVVGLVSVLPFGESVPDDELLEVEGEWLWLLFWELAVGALVGWLTYRRTGDVMESAIAGVGAMIVLTIWRGAVRYRASRR